LIAHLEQQQPQLVAEKAKCMVMGPAVSSTGRLSAGLRQPKPKKEEEEEEEKEEC